MIDKSKVLKTYGICETNSRLCLSLKMNRLPIYVLHNFFPYCANFGFTMLRDFSLHKK